MILRSRLGAIALILMFACSFQSCHVGRFFYWNFANISDYKKFPADDISSSKVLFNYPKAAKPHPIFQKQLTFKEGSSTFSEILDESRTAAFLVIRNDSILFEEYHNGYERESMLTSFSVAKSFVSSLIGIALEEGHIQGIDQPITDYLKDLQDPAFSKITIEHVLNMRSGIEYNEGYYNPFGDVAKYYYGTNLKKYMQKLEIAESPDESFDYISVNTQILAAILEEATGKPVSQYMEEKIWQNLGSEFEASWSLDSKRNHTNKAFCCINARAIDFAKFGSMFLHEGQWQGKQVVPKRWVDFSTRIHEDSKQNFYGYQWWHAKTSGAYTDTITVEAGYPYRLKAENLASDTKRQYVAKGDYDFIAQGILGQYIYVYPPKNLVMVRLGKKYNDLSWSGLFLELAKAL